MSASAIRRAYQPRGGPGSGREREERAEARERPGVGGYEHLHLGLGGAQALGERAQRGPVLGSIVGEEPGGSLELAVGQPARAVAEEERAVDQVRRAARGVAREREDLDGAVAHRERLAVRERP